MPRRPHDEYVRIPRAILGCANGPLPDIRCPLRSVLNVTVAAPAVFDNSA